MIEIVNELSRSADPRDAEAGLAFCSTYYIKHVGSHEVVMERLYLSTTDFLPSPQARAHARWGAARRARGLIPCA